MERERRSAYLAEAIGTFFLVLFIALTLAVNSEAGLGSLDLLMIGMVHAFALMMIIATIGGASGAHVNPAVTIALCAIRKIAPVDAAIYILVQLAGAVLAVLVVKALLVDGSGDATNFGAPAVADNFLEGKALAGFLGEAIGTFALMWAIMGVAVNPRAAKDWAPVVIGATLGLAVFCLGPMTGGSFNPARAFAPALISAEFGDAGTFVLSYMLGPILGALAAAFAYSAVVLQERQSARPIDKLG